MRRFVVSVVVHCLIALGEVLRGEVDTLLPADAPGPAVAGIAEAAPRCVALDVAPLCALGEVLAPVVDVDPIEKVALLYVAAVPDLASFLGLSAPEAVRQAELALQYAQGEVLQLALVELPVAVFVDAAPPACAIRHCARSYMPALIPADYLPWSIPSMPLYT